MKNKNSRWCANTNLSCILNTCFATDKFTTRAQLLCIILCTSSRDRRRRCLARFLLVYPVSTCNTQLEHWAPLLLHRTALSRERGERDKTTGARPKRLVQMARRTENPLFHTLCRARSEGAGSRLRFRPLERNHARCLIAEPVHTPD